MRGRAVFQLKLDKNSPLISVDLIAQQVERRTGISKVRNFEFGHLYESILRYVCHLVEFSSTQQLIVGGSLSDSYLCWMNDYYRDRGHFTFLKTRGLALMLPPGSIRIPTLFKLCGLLQLTWHSYFIKWISWVLHYLNLWSKSCTLWCWCVEKYIYIYILKSLFSNL